VHNCQFEAPQKVQFASVSTFGQLHCIAHETDYERISMHVSGRVPRRKSLDFVGDPDCRRFRITVYDVLPSAVASLVFASMQHHSRRKLEIYDRF